VKRRQLVKKRKLKAPPVVREGNFRKGEAHFRARLSDHDVELFRELVEGGMSQREACEKFEISRAHGSRLARYLRRR